MKYELKTHFRIKRDRLPPSMQAEGLSCTRQLWLMHRHVAMDEEAEWKDDILTLKSHLSDEWKHDWQFEIRLPSGTRIDARIPEEEVLVEFKTARPGTKHLYQVWMMMEELEELAVTDAEFQLWYLNKWNKEALKLAESLGFDAAENAAGFIAMAVDRPDADFLRRRERDTAIMLGDLEQAKPPPPKEIDSAPCRDCLFLEFCHI